MKFKYNETANKALEMARVAGGRLPSERELCEICGVSRITAKKALNSLKEQGVVTRHIGKGTFIAEGVDFPKVNFMMVSASVPPEVREYLKQEAEKFLGSGSSDQIEFTEIKENVISAIQGTGTKIVLWPYLGRLSNLGAFSCLDELSGFYEMCSKIEASFCDWSRGLDSRMRCTSVPLNFNANVFGYNWKFAKKLGLDYENGPSCWEDVIEWSVRCSRDKKVSPSFMSKGFRQVIPFSYYLTASKGKDYLEETSAGLDFSFTGGSEWLRFFRGIYSSPNNYIMKTPGPDPLTRRKSLFSCQVGTWILTHQGTPLSSEISLKPIPPLHSGGSSYSNISKNCLGIVPGGDQDGVALAWEFIKYLLTDVGAQERLVNTFPVIAANNKVRYDQAGKPEWEPFISSFNNGRMLSSHPIRFGIDELIRECFDECVTGQIEPDAAAKKAIEFGKLLIKIERERTWF